MPFMDAVIVLRCFVQNKPYLKSKTNKPMTNHFSSNVLPIQEQLREECCVESPSPSKGRQPRSLAICRDIAGVA